MPQPQKPSMLLSDPRILRGIVWFVSAGVLLYLAAIFWFGRQEAVAALMALGWQPY